MVAVGIAVAAWSFSAGADGGRGSDPVARATSRPERPVAMAMEMEAEGAPVTRQAPDGPPVRVLDAGGAPVVGAAVRWFRQEDQRRGATTTDEAGVAHLPETGHFLVAVEPLEGVGAIDFHEVDGHGFAVRLPASGAVEVRVIDEQGRPVEGVRVSLTHPEGTGRNPLGGYVDPDRMKGEAPWVALAREALAGNAPVNFLGRRWRLERRRPQSGGSPIGRFWDEAWPPLESSKTTDTRGRLHFPFVPPGEQYRLRVGRGVHLDLQGIPEGIELREDGSVRGRVGVPDLGHGPAFAVVAGEVAHQELSVLTPAAVVGWIDPGEHAWDESPSLIIMTTPLHLPGFTSNRLERDSAAEVDGHIELTGLRPGTTTLRVSWLDEQGRRRALERRFELRPGETLDLGVLRAAVGRELELRFVVRDGEGELLLPEVVTPDATFGRRCSLRLRIDRKWVGIADDVQPWIGESVILTGLPEGERYFLSYGLISAGTVPGYVFRKRSVQLEGPFPEEGVLEVPVVVLRTVEATLHLRGLEEGQRPPSAVILRGVRSTSVCPKGTGPWTFEAVPGRYQVYTVAAWDELPGVYCAGEVDVRTGADVVLDVRPAAGVRGRVSLGEEVLWAGPGSILPEHSYEVTHTWSCQVEDDGHFQLGGLPPRTFLVLICGDEMRLIETGEAGSVTELDWR